MKIRPELSDRNPYKIPKNRFYELKYFCMQYPEWKSRLIWLEDLATRSTNYISKPDKFKKPDDITKRIAFMRAHYSRLIDMVDEAAEETDPIIGPYILYSVVEGISYDTSNARNRIPCCREKYYELYRKFFWILDKKR